MTDTKRCARCKTDKPLEDFARRKASADGRQWYCRICASIYRAKRTARVPPTPPSPSEREHHRAVMAQWRDRNREHYRQYQRAYQRAHGAKYRARKPENPHDL